MATTLTTEAGLSRTSRERRHDDGSGTELRVPGRYWRLLHRFCLGMLICSASYVVGLILYLSARPLKEPMIGWGVSAAYWPVLELCSSSEIAGGIADKCADALGVKTAWSELIFWHRVDNIQLPILQENTKSGLGLANQ